MDIAPILLIALPMTLIIITGEIDLSVASMLGLSACVPGLLVHDHGWSVPAARRGRPAWSASWLRRAQRLPGRVRRTPVARGHDRHARALPRHRGRPDRHQGRQRFPQRWRDLANKHIGTTSYPLIVIPFVVLADRLRAPAALHAVRPRRLRDRPERRDRPLQRRRRTPEQAAALRPQRRRLGLRRRLLPAAVRQRQHRHRHRPGAPGDRGRAARRRVHLRRARRPARVIAGVLLIGVLSSALRLQATGPMSSRSSSGAPRRSR